MKATDIEIQVTGSQEVKPYRPATYPILPPDTTYVNCTLNFGLIPILALVRSDARCSEKSRI